MGFGLAIAVDGTADPELAGAASVEVFESMGETTTFHLRYPVDISEGDVSLLMDGRLTAGSELSIFAGVGDDIVCLAKGPVFAQQIHLAHGGAGSYVDVQGADNSITMDRESKAKIWSDITDSDAVSTILGEYALSPDIEGTPASHAEAKHALVQRESDLRFVRRLARRNGMLFWISCDESGVETAHFKRAPLEGEPTTELIINLASPTVEMLDISWDVERPTSVRATQLDLNGKADIDGSVSISPLTSLANKRLSAIAVGPRSMHLTVPVDDAGDLGGRAEGALIEAEFFVRAKCQTTLTALGSLVRAHTLVNMRGAGSRHSGKYFCSGVRHLIDNTVHRMEVELIRNAWGA